MNQRILATLLLLLATGCDTAPTRTPSAPPRAPAPEATRPVPAPPAPEATRPAPAPPRDTTIAVVVHPALPPYRFTLFGTAGSARADSVLVFRGTEPRPVQVMRFAENELMAAPKPITTGDLDFDGNQDVRIAVLNDEHNALWEHRVFELSTGTFRLVGVSTYLKPNLHTHSLSGHMRAGLSGSIWYSYEWEGDSLVLRDRWHRELGVGGDGEVSHSYRRPEEPWRLAGLLPRDRTFEIVIHPSLPPYRFAHRRNADSMLVFRGTETRPVQVMGAADSHRSVPIIAEDLNFDGYRDVQISDPFWAGIPAEQWLFEPSTGTFRYVGGFLQLSPDPRTRELTDFLLSGCCAGISRTYAWKGDSLVMIRRTAWEPSGDSTIYHYYERRGGVLRKVGRKTVFAEVRGEYQ